MAVITRGQITIVDLNDGKSINLYLGSNHPTTQIFNQENSSYTPNWSDAPYLAVTPELYVSGVATSQVSRIKDLPTWKINGSSDIASFGGAASTSSPYTLNIRNNLTTTSQLRIECEVVYVDPDTSAETKAKAQITFSKATNTGQTIRAIAYAPNGTIFKNGDVETLKAHCDLWRGSSIDNTNVTYTWQKLESGVWRTLSSVTAGGISGYTTSEITIPASEVLNFESFKCSVKDTDTASGTYNTVVSDIISFADVSDPYQVEIRAPSGTTLSSGLTSIALLVCVWRNGEEVPISFYNDATCTWRKYNKNGVLDTSWGTDGVQKCRTISVTRDEISVAATFTVEIEK